MSSSLGKQEKQPSNQACDSLTAGWFLSSPRNLRHVSQELNYFFCIDSDACGCFLRHTSQVMATDNNAHIKELLK